MDLYKKLCGWLLDWNTNDGVFGHCFLVLTWNLSRRTHNTANIWLCEIEWGSTFDAFEIYFAHMKTDQTGDEAKYSHHLYANPCCPLICPVLSLAFYFSCCCNLSQSGESRLFPGWDQYQRFSEMLSRLIQDHEAEVSELGVNPQMIGMHSIRKGAVTLHVIPSWWSINFISMYSCWVDHGVCQGCLHVLFIIRRSVCRSLSDDVAIIADGVCVTPPPPPPNFIPAWDDWGKTDSAQQFPMFDDIPQFLHLKLMCLASVVHHRHFIVERFNANHIVLASGQLFPDEAVLHQLDNNPDCVVVTYLEDHSWGFLPMLLFSKNSTL